MLFKVILFSLGCLLAWLVVFPLLFIGGGIALFAYALLAELGALLMGKTGNTVDMTVARETARRMCGGYGVQARNMRCYAAPKDFDALSVIHPTSTSS